jgi:hypothetical protein
MKPTILDCPPEGFWIEDGRGKWMGPYASDEEAERTARMLCPNGTVALEIRKLSSDWARMVHIPQKAMVKHDGDPKHPNRCDGQAKGDS